MARNVFSEEWLAQHMAKLGKPGKAAPAPPEQPRRPKYGNERVQVAGDTFDSVAEADRWQQLELMQKAGLISELRRQVPFELAPAVRLDGRMKPAMRYTADAVYMENGAVIVEDTKSEATRKTTAYRMRKHLMMSVHKIEIRECQKCRKSSKS